MNDQEKRKEALTNLTEEERDNLQKDIKELLQWNAEAREALELKLQEEGKWISYGLDSNQQYYHDIIEEYQRRFRAIQIKYGIMNQ